MTREKNAGERLRAEVDQYTWYHKIDLGSGVITPGLDLEPIWDMIRQTRKHLDYTSKKVLDVASFDGMWAFEAEKLNAAAVIATDCNYPAFRNFLFCRERLGSGVLPFFNVAPYNIAERLDSCFQMLHGDSAPYPNLFDIVQYLGLLYHVRDPLLCLNQARSVTGHKGYLLLETAAVMDDQRSFMLFNGVPPGPGRIYPDITTWWAPSFLCLKELLKASLFEPLEETIKVLPQTPTIGRISLVAKAIGPKAVTPEYYQELTRRFRNPGLTVETLEK